MSNGCIIVFFARVTVGGTNLPSTVTLKKKAAGKTWTWTYDDAGNITAKKEYNYTTGTLGTALDTISYTYGNSTWGDQLTGYDGNTVSYYILSGNPWMDGT